MKGRSIRLVIALALVASSFAAFPIGGLASDPDRIFFPWVPNGTMIDDPRGFDSLGPFYGSITVQNPNNETILVYYIATYGGTVEPFQGILLDPYESTTLTAEFLGIPAGTGSGVVLRGETMHQQQPRPIAAVLKQASPVPLFDNSKTSGQHATVGGYTGLDGEDLGNNIVLPIAQTNNNWNTLIRVTNFDPVVHSQTHLWLHEAGGGETLGPFVQHTPPGATTTFDLLELGVPEGFVGSAVIGSSTLGAVAERVKNETSMLVMNTSTSTSAPGDLQHAPLIFREWFHWNTGISVANLSAEENDITVRYYAMDGEEVHSDDLTIPANGMDFLYLPAGAGDNEFVGSAIIEASHPFVAAVDEVKYLGNDDDTGHAMSYMVEEGAVASLGHTLILPLYQKGDPDTGMGDTSGIQLFNPNEGFAFVSVWILDSQGEVVQSWTGPTLEPKQGATIYAMEQFDVPTGFTGSVMISVIASGQDGAIVAVSNNVNYAVQFDGSASFNLIHMSTLPTPQL